MFTIGTKVSRNRSCGSHVALKLVVATMLLLPASALASWPPEAAPYRSLWAAEFTRSGIAREHEARLLGQLTQESSWRADARSAAGAEGLAQITPGTERLVDRAYPDLSGLGGPYDAHYAIRAFLELMGEALHRWRHAPDAETVFAWAAADYNGGPGWLLREHRAGGWVRTMKGCRAAGRSEAACRENLTYADSAEQYAPRFAGGGG